MTGACDRTDGGNKAALSAEPLGAEPMQPPILRHFADLSVAVARPTVIGDTGTGERRLVAIVGGTVSGSRLTGTILPGGSDDQRIGADGVTHIHARYLIEAEDGALIHVESVGLRSGAPEVMARLLRGETVSSTDVYFVTTLRFETSAARYRWMGGRVFIANGERRGDRVFLSVYEVVA